MIIQNKWYKEEIKEEEASKMRDFTEIPKKIQDAWIMYLVLRETAQEKFDSGQMELAEVCDPELYPMSYQDETLPVIHEMCNDIESYL